MQQKRYSEPRSKGRSAENDSKNKKRVFIDKINKEQNNLIRSLPKI